MSYRDPVVVWVNYFYGIPCIFPLYSFSLVFKDDPYRRDPASRAASLTRGALLFRQQLVEYAFFICYLFSVKLCLLILPEVPLFVWINIDTCSTQQESPLFLLMLPEMQILNKIISLLLSGKINFSKSILKSMGEYYLNSN